MRQRGRASCCALLLLALLALWQYQEDLLSLGSYCFASREQAEADRNTIATCQLSVDRERHRVLDISRCYRSCLFACTKQGWRGSKDEMSLACTYSAQIIFIYHRTAIR